MEKITKNLARVQQTKILVSKEVERLQTELERTQKTLEIKQNQLESIEKEVTRLENNELVVSDHALLRYMERIVGIDMDMIKNAILTDNVKRMHLALGDGKYPVAVENNDHCMVVIRNGVVVTLYSGTDPEN